MKKISSIELANRGWLLVNIPSITIILIVWYCLAAYLGINGKISAIVGGALGWIYWELTVKKMIKLGLNYKLKT